MFQMITYKIRRGRKLYENLSLYNMYHLITYKKVITYKGKIAKIPYFYCSNGHINSNKKYPYIKDCACPWDAVNKERTDKTIGVSLNTINYLTKQGSNCKEALGRFLDNVEITEYSSKKRERVE